MKHLIAAALLGLSVASLQPAGATTIDTIIEERVCIKTQRRHAGYIEAGGQRKEIYQPAGIKCRFVPKTRIRTRIQP